ncbi:MAG: hypothetical protein P4L59_21205 [Desulfosporosinus sp.]|nr:hypothetical protein [Desulfosporosinus sp.]
MASHPRSFKRMLGLLFLLISSGIFVLVGCSYSVTPSSSSTKNTIQPFMVDYNISSQGPVFRLLTLHGKEKIEILDGKFSDGTSILESIMYLRDSNRWNQITMRQETYQPNDPVRGAGNGQFGILELVNPNIVRVEYETKQEKIKLSISQVKNRRFVVYKQTPENMEFYQVYAINNSGQVLWQFFPEGYWKE